MTRAARSSEPVATVPRIDLMPRSVLLRRHRDAVLRWRISLAVAAVAVAGLATVVIATLFGLPGAF
jgi:hypothetical protein